MLQTQIIRRALQGPLRVVIVDEVAAFLHLRQVIVDPGDGVVGGVNGVGEDTLLPGPAFGVAGPGAVELIEHGHPQIIRLLGDEVEVVHRLEPGGMDALVPLDADFVAVEGDKVLVRQILVADEHLVIGEAHGAVAQGFEGLLDLLGGLSAVGDVGVAVHVDFVKLSAFGDEFLHGRGLPFVNCLHYTSVLLPSSIDKSRIDRQKTSIQIF